MAEVAEVAEAAKVRHLGMTAAARSVLTGAEEANWVDAGLESSPMAASAGEAAMVRSEEPAKGALVALALLAVERGAEAATVPSAEVKPGRATAVQVAVMARMEHLVPLRRQRPRLQVDRAATGWCR